MPKIEIGKLEMDETLRRLSDTLKVELSETGGDLFPSNDASLPYDTGRPLTGEKLEEFKKKWIAMRRETADKALSVL